MILPYRSLGRRGTSVLLVRGEDRTLCVSEGGGGHNNNGTSPITTAETHSTA